MSDKQPPISPTATTATNELVIPFPATTTPLLLFKNLIWIERALKSWKLNLKKEKKKRKMSGRSKGSQIDASVVFFFLPLQNDEPDQKVVKKKTRHEVLNFGPALRRWLVHLLFSLYTWQDTSSSSRHFTIANKVDEGEDTSDVLRYVLLDWLLLLGREIGPDSPLMLLTRHWTCSSSLRLMHRLPTNNRIAHFLSTVETCRTHRRTDRRTDRHS